MQQNDPTQISGATVGVGVPEEFQSHSAPSDVTFQSKGVTPPSRVYIGRDDQLQIQAFGGPFVTQIAITYRVLLASGIIIPFQDTIVVQPRLTSTITYQLAEGFLLSVTACNQSNNNGPTTYVVAEIVRKSGNQGNVFSDQLFAGYATVVKGLSFPESVPERATAGAGLIRSITVSNPAAGNEWLVLVPTPARWRLVTATMRFVASATVATRAPSLLITDGVNNLFRAAPNFTIAAGAGAVYYFADGIPNSVDTGNTQNVALPSQLHLSQTMTIGSSTGNIQAGDQYNLIQLLVEEWAEE